LPPHEQVLLYNKLLKTALEIGHDVVAREIVKEYGVDELYTVAAKTGEGSPPALVIEKYAKEGSEHEKQTAGEAAQAQGSAAASADDDCFIVAP
jgi:hypothetical protein